MRRIRIVQLLLLMEMLMGVESLTCGSTASSYTTNCFAFGRVRKDWQSLSNNERNKFVNAFVGWVNQCKTNPNTAESCVYACRYADVLKNNLLKDSNNLLYHKTLLMDIEDSLVRFSGDPSITIPYGNWEPVFAAPPLYDPSKLVPGGPTDGTSCSDWSNTPFSSLQKIPPCATRSPANPVKKVNQPDYNKALGSNKFNNFNTLIIGSLQKIIHQNYGGSMTSTDASTSPIFDPVFLLHQANIQRLFLNWKLQNLPGSLFYPGNFLDYFLPQYTNIVSGFAYYSECAAYGSPSYDPLTPAANGANGGFGGGFDGSGSGFWGGNKKRASPNFLTANTTVELADSISTLVPLGFGQNFLFALSQAPGGLGYDLKHFLEGIYFGSFGVNASFSNITSDAELVAQVVPKIDYGIGFDYAVAFASSLQDFQKSTKGLWKLGAKYNQNRPNFVMAQILSALRTDRGLQDFTETVAVLFQAANNSNNPTDSPLQQKLQEAGAEIVSRFAGIVSPATPLSTTSSAPAGWLCPAQYYGTGDGCDCACGVDDPDCTPDTTPFATDNPVFGCWDMPSPVCSNGLCFRGPSPPAEWTCPEAQYNSTDGCDCGCGVQDPDCDLHFTGNQKEAAPYLYRVAGCTEGVGAVCVDGQCTYDRQVPSNWTCPQEDYGSGGLCDCSCGAYDPDCATSTNIVGCGCPGLTCKNSLGLCEGQCTNNGATVKLLGGTPTPYCPAGSSAPDQFTPSPSATCPQGNGQAKVKSSFLQLLAQLAQT